MSKLLFAFDHPFLLVYFLKNNVLIFCMFQIFQLVMNLHIIQNCSILQSQDNQPLHSNLQIILSERPACQLYRPEVQPLKRMQIQVLNTGNQPTEAQLLMLLIDQDWYLIVQLGVLTVLDTVAHVECIKLNSLKPLVPLATILETSYTKSQKEWSTSTMKCPSELKR